ncbi:hypothetical protein JX265_000552 [Neoarthrinium moseri]|uniref:Mediator of RNA polymerase II transcription subunit 31 n=1 Tax=Neoarthrinium moseri TaxID=1658444 RepID=A0A9P9WYR7_9PEZI|nr:hypothetical protein JX265_000552 [Neoarthrinium moseri]
MGGGEDAAQTAKPSIAIREIGSERRRKAHSIPRHRRSTLARPHALFLDFSGQQPSPSAARLFASLPPARGRCPMSQSPPNPPAEAEPLYGGFTRFEIELEFVQSLANPFYLNHLASQKLLSEPAFVEYLKYLQYWSKPPYLKYLTYPGPTLKHLELLQQERFRQEIISPELVHLLAAENQKASIDWHKEE